MMGSKRPGPAAMRLGGLLGVALTGGGLLLTASGGVAAETKAAMRAEVTTTMARIAPPSPPPAPPAVYAPAPPPAPDALAMADTVEAPPIPPIPPVPPVPPVPASSESAFIDAGEIERDVREATRDAMREAAEATREAAGVTRQALRTQVVMRDCRRDRERRRASMSMRGDEDGHQIRRIVVCEDGGVDKAMMRKTMISALESARLALVSMDSRTLAAEGQARALAELDRKLAELKAQ